MEKLIQIWEEIWGEDISSVENFERSFRLLNDILVEIKKENDDHFIKERLKASRSVNIVVKKLYFEFAPIEKIQNENPFLVKPDDLPEVNVMQSDFFKKQLDISYLEAEKNNEVGTRICEKCGAIENFIEETYYGKPILVCIEADCLQQYTYTNPSTNQLKIPQHWLGLKYTVYQRRNKKGFKEWVDTQIEQFKQLDNLEVVEYDNSSKKIEKFWNNISIKVDETDNNSNKIDDGIDVFNKGGHWYYWVLGFKSFRLNKQHRDREFNQEIGCSCRFCKMDF